MLPIGEEHSSIEADKAEEKSPVPRQDIPSSSSYITRSFALHRHFFVSYYFFSYIFANNTIPVWTKCSFYSIGQAKGVALAWKINTH